MMEVGGVYWGYGGIGSTHSLLVPSCKSSRQLMILSMESTDRNCQYWEHLNSQWWKTWKGLG